MAEPGAKTIPQFIQGDADTVNSQIKRLFLNKDVDFDQAEWEVNAEGIITVQYFLPITVAEKV